MISKYEIAIYGTSGALLGSKVVADREAAENHFLFLTKLHTASDGFYVDDKQPNSYSVIDLSYSAKVIKLIGSIDEGMKQSLKARFMALLENKDWA